MAGIASNASRQVQGAPGYLVTSNVDGDLAAYTPSQLGLASTSDVQGLQMQINRLDRRNDELTEGIASSAALAQPIFLPGQSFAMQVSWGNFDSANAFGVTAAGVVARNLLRPGGGALVLNGGVGVGTDQGVVTTRVGLGFGW
jgi:hypothetical protein